LQLRWLVLGITLAGMISFMAVAAFDHSAARVALAGSIVVAFNGVTWLLICRQYRFRLRRHGFRW
jgi:membrane protein YdbS with pleckstrin-like domain